MYLMCTLFPNLYVLSTWGPHMVYMGSPHTYILYLMIKYGWLGTGLYLIVEYHLITYRNKDKILTKYTHKKKFLVLFL